MVTMSLAQGSTAVRHGSNRVYGVKNAFGTVPTCPVDIGNFTDYRPFRVPIPVLAQSRNSRDTARNARGSDHVIIGVR